MPLLADGQTNATKSSQHLAVYFGRNLSFCSHVFVVCRFGFYPIWNLQHIHQYLYLYSANLLLHAFVSSHLDYQNTGLSGITEVNLTKLRCVQNRLARVVKNDSIYSQCSTLVLSNLQQCRVESTKVSFASHNSIKNSSTLLRKVTCELISAYCKVRPFSNVFTMSLVCKSCLNRDNQAESACFEWMLFVAAWQCQQICPWSDYPRCGN